VTGAASLGDGRRPPPLASLLAFGLAILAEAGAVALVFGTASDPSGVRWWLVFAPVVIASLPVVVPVYSVSVGAAASIAIWTAIASASIGLFFVPAAMAALVAARPTSDGGVRLKSDTGRSCA